MEEELRVRSVSHVHGVYRGFAVEGGLGQVFVVEQAIVEQGLFTVFAAHEMMGLQDARNAAIEAPDHPVGLRCTGSGQAMLNPALCDEFAKATIFIT
jgi:hypothetical protein